MTRRDESKTSFAVAAEAPLNIPHELPPDGLERVNTECTLGSRSTIIGSIALGEDGEKHVVLCRNSKVSGQIRASFSDVRGLHEVINSALVCAVDGHLSVRVVMLIIMADSDQLGNVDGCICALHLSGQEVAEALTAESVDVVDRIPLPRQ